MTHIDLAAALLNHPTAPLLEIHPRAFIRQFAAARPALKLIEDAAGNSRVDLRCGTSASPPLVLVAHLDHPGFHVKRVEGLTAELEFHGWHSGVHALPGTRVHFFDASQTQPIGAGELIERDSDSGPLKRASARIADGRANIGGFAMWGFPGYALETQTDNAQIISARCCDDLLGAAAILSVFDALLKLAPPEVNVIGLFTRAEEIGFLGTLEAIRLKTIPQNSCVLSLECSKAFAHAPQGGGVIVRVGDASSIFDPGLTQALTLAAKKLSEFDTGFKFQRKLMDGGTCEATPFCAHGYRASGLALPLGNYHNQAFDANGRACVGPETVDAADFENEIKLLVELALHPQALDPGADKIPQRIKDLALKAHELLR